MNITASELELHGDGGGGRWGGAWRCRGKLNETELRGNTPEWGSNSLNVTNKDQTGNMWFLLSRSFIFRHLIAHKCFGQMVFGDLF